MALVLVLAALLAALPDRASNGTTARLRFGPLTVVAFAAALAALDVGEPVAEAFAGALRHVADPWRYSANADAFERLDGSWPFHGAVACTVALLTAAAAVLAFRLRNTPAGMAATATAAFGSVATVPVAAIALRAPYLAAVLALVLLGVALVLFAARPSAERGGEVNDGVLSVGTSGKPRSVPPGTLDGVLLAAGAAAIALGLGWSLAASTATAWALGVLMAASLVGRGLLAPAGRPLASALAVAAIAAEAGVLAGATGAAGAEAGTVAIAAASLLAVAARLLREATERIVVETTCAFAALCAASTLGEDPHWAAIALLIVGVASAAVAMDPARRRLGWLSGTMLTLSSWVRLADTDVSTPEAYTLPPAAALLIYGALAHRGNRDLSSWRTFGPGLALALIPSLLATFDDDGLTRALLVGGGALVALLAGAAGRWQAPLALGAATLAVDAVVQVAPFADAVPRWVGIGLAGALLLALGATFEKRLRDLRRVADGFAHLG
ncbi:MAG: SCO7613 C-terminal domain-containing membrane protein [Sporichthyaceae bacterium]